MHLDRVKGEANACRCGNFCRIWCPVHEIVKSESTCASGYNYYARGVLRGLVEYTPSSALFLYRCAGCGACTWARCPFSPPIDTRKVVEAMRADIVGLGLAPRAVVEFGENLERHHNPYGLPHEERFNWLSSEKGPKEKAEMAYFVGCMASYRTNLNPIPEAMVKILDAVNEDFVVLGGEECCCGLPALKAGHRAVAKRLAEHNVKAIHDAGVETVLTGCPACYVSFRQDYPEEYDIDVDFDIIHSTEYLLDLIEDGKLKLPKAVKGVATYHDPCHLGRFAKMYDQPREVLSNVRGLRLVEMERNRQYARCCGGGIQVPWENLALQIGMKRFEDAAQTGAEILTTACPLCKHMFDSALLETETKMDVYNIEELILKAMGRGSL